jgi:hypothetical protein
MEEIKAQEGFIKESLYRIGFWFLIIFLAGFISGLFFAQEMIIEKRLSDSVRLKGIIIGNTVYDLKVAPP